MCAICLFFFLLFLDFERALMRKKILQNFFSVFLKEHQKICVFDFQKNKNVTKELLWLDSHSKQKRPKSDFLFFSCGTHILLFHCGVNSIVTIFSPQRNPICATDIYGTELDTYPIAFIASTVREFMLQLSHLCRWRETPEVCN